jgi:hypothetical protein
MIFRRFLTRIKKFLVGFPKWFGLYLGIAGLSTFSMFIMEEAFQTCMFGSWPAADVGEWRLVKRNLQTMEGLHSTLATMTTVGGWINPFAYFAYRGYEKAEREYIDALRAKCMANCPECFAGEEFSVEFNVKEKEIIERGWMAKNGVLYVLTDMEPPDQFRVKGILQKSRGRLVIDLRSK